MGRRTILLAVVLGALAWAGTASAENYIVLYKQQAVSAGAAKAIQQAGGSLVYAYGQIGVAIASSSNPAFRSNLLRDGSVEGVSGTTGFATRLAPEQATDAESS